MPANQYCNTASTHEDGVAVAAAALLRRVGWRILPLLLVLYFIAYLDRINIGFAAGSMQRDLGFSDRLYGAGAGVFFLGYLLAQVPSNMLLYRFGARRTISVLMVVWSAVSGSMAFVHGPAMFLSLRFLLGVAEAGFYPGVILYLTLWLPRRVRTGYTAWFLFAIPLASIFGGPLSTAVLQHGRIGRFAGWQMLLLTEAFPALIAGALLPWIMTDSPAQARWLTEGDRGLLAETHAADEPSSEEDVPVERQKGYRIGRLLHVLRFAAIYFAIQFALYAQSFWLPKILHGLGVPSGRIGWDVSAVYIIAAVGMLGWGRIADRASTQRWTLGAPLLAAAIGFACTAIPYGKAGLAPVLIAFGFGAAGGLAATPAFWSQVTLRQRTADIAGTIALVNALGNIGGFAGPALLGELQQRTGSHGAGMLAASGFLALGTLLLYSRPSKALQQP